MKSELSREVESVQSLFAKNLSRSASDPIPTQDFKGILSAVRDVNYSVAADCFGNLGINIKSFTEDFNPSHPAVGVLTSSISDQPLMMEVLSLHEVMSENDCQGLMEFFRQFFSHAGEIEGILNSAPVRAMSSDVSRRRRRFSYRHPGIFSRYMEVENDVAVWQNAPNSMLDHVRLSDKPSSEVELETRRAMYRKFCELGMDFQASACMNYIDRVLRGSVEDYCGFHPLPPDSISSTLGKVHGFVCNKHYCHLSLEKNKSLTRFLSDRICMSPKLLSELAKIGGESWYSQEPTTATDMVGFILEHVGWSGFFHLISRKVSLFFYRARFYSTSDLADILPENVESVVKELDHFRDYGGLPLFDHYLVAVPSVKVSEMFFNDKYSKYFFKDEGNCTRGFSTREEASYFLDSMLIQSKVVSPFLVGKKDDQLFPLCYCF